MGEARRWWLKIENAFFDDRFVLKLKRTFSSEAVLLYLKIMLISLENDCRIRFEHLDETIEEELAGGMHNEYSAELIGELFGFLETHKRMIRESEDLFYFPQAEQLSGGEGASAKRMREKRKRDAEAEMSQSDGTASQRSATKARDISISSSIGITDLESQLNPIENSDIEIKKTEKTEAEQDSESDSDSDCDAPEARSGEARASPGGQPAPLPGSGGVTWFSVEQLQQKVDKYKVNLTHEGVEAFFQEMQGSGWQLYGRPVEQDQIIKALRGWAKFHEEFHKPHEPAQEAAYVQGQEAVEEKILAWGQETMPVFVWKYLEKTEKDRLYKLTACVWYGEEWGNIRADYDKELTAYSRKYLNIAPPHEVRVAKYDDVTGDMILTERWKMVDPYKTQRSNLESAAQRWLDRQKSV